MTCLRVEVVERGGGLGARSIRVTAEVQGSRRAGRSEPGKPPVLEGFQVVVEVDGVVDLLEVADSQAAEGDTGGQANGR